MPTGFTKEQQETIKEKLFIAGIKLIRELGVQRTTVDKLTKKCGIAKGSFYLFYSSKEEYLLALSEYANAKMQDMLLKKLSGRKQMTTKEFFEFYREYLYSDYDLMGSMNIDDFLWLKQHMADYHLFDPSLQIITLKQWLKLMSDARKDIDPGTVVNLIKSIYAMREHRDTLIEASLDNSIEIVLRTLEIYISGKGNVIEKR